MGYLSVETNIQGAEFKSLSRRLKEAGNGKDLQKRMRAEIKQAGKPVVQDIANAARAVEVSSSQGGDARPNDSTGLREAVAKATQLSVTQTGVRIRVSGNRFQTLRIRQSLRISSGSKNLPKYLNASPGYERWRHPVFGHSVWTTQRGERFFHKTAASHSRDFRAAIQQAMDGVAEEIAD